MSTHSGNPGGFLFRRALALGFVLGCVAAATNAGAPPLGGLGAFGSKGKAGAAVAESAPRVRVEARPLQNAVTPGGAFGVAIVLEHAEHWHTWPSAAQNVLPKEIAEFAIRTSVDPPASLPGWIAALGSVQWPAPMPGAVADISHPGKSMEVPLYQGRAVAYVPVFVSRSAQPGPARVSFTIGYQACNESTCEAPETVEVTVEVLIVAGAGAAAIEPPDAEQAALLAGFDSSVLATPPVEPPASASNANDARKAPIAVTPAGGSEAGEVGGGGGGGGASFFGLTISGLSGPLGFVLLSLLSALGGLVLNLTPCVLPVIPIKVMTLTKHAGSPGRSLVLGLWMAAGVIAFWFALGIPAAAFSSLADPSRLFGIWWLTTGIGAIIALMGLGIMGLFAFNLPQQVYMVNPDADSAGGSFMFGVMTAVLGLPCFGFVAGALLPAAAAFGPSATLTVFASIGVGMALPYLVLAARPAWIEKVPRTGPASELVKQVMGLLLLAAAMYFIGAGMIALVQDYPYLAKQLHWWAVAFLGSASGVWLIYRTFRITPRIAPRLAFTALGLIVAAGGVASALKSTGDARREYLATKAAREEAEKRGGDGALITSAWVDYSEPLLARALASGKVVVMDFTAEWCLNCKTLKAAVLNVAPVRPVLESEAVVMIRVDLTSARAPGWEKLRSLGQTGIPLLAILGPGLSEPWMSNAYTAEQVLGAIARARADGALSEVR